jgi:hypothetical protein
MLVLCLSVAFSGCSGMKRLQEPIVKFDESMHSLAVAQMSFFHAVQVADCNQQFYTKAYEYAFHDQGSFYLAGACQPAILDDDQLHLRQSLMDALVLYADKMTALAVNDDDKALSANSQKLAGRLAAVAKQGGFGSMAVSSGVGAAVTAIGEMALDQRRFGTVTEAAAAMEPHLEAVIGTLKMENTIFAYGIAGKTDRIEGYLRELVLSTHQQRGRETFLDIIAARRIVQSANPFGLAPGGASGIRDPQQEPEYVADQLNASLDAALNANRAIAGAGTGGLIAAVNDLAARAGAAQAMQKELVK